MTKETFEKWLIENSDLSISTVKKYSGAINTISKELQKHKLLNGSLFNIDDYLLMEKMILSYFEIPEYQEKDIRGNRMYSSALRYLRISIEKN